MTAPRYICIHGHFYQPPRENPWLEAVEVQDSAAPFHDWNERITRECYAPNSRTRLLDGQGKIIGLINNYAWMSFNFGPTLLSWMAEAAPEVLHGIVEGDRLSRERRRGHGNALAQVYNHIIMPLASARDKRTQVVWGIADFKRRFGRDPEGMWLAETAVDLPTLEMLAAFGIRFTVLAPRQAKRWRPIGDGEWTEIPEGVDPSRAYLCRLPSGKSMALFFYDGIVSRQVAFERLLDSGEKFLGRLMQGFDPARQHAQLMHMATDGESYGHHHPHGDMALAYVLNRLGKDDGVRLTNYGEFLELHPPEWEVEIHENSSWSCAHGVERWRSNCGCNMGRGWQQEWRGPMRKAMDALKGRLDDLFVARGPACFPDPWSAFEAYLEVIFDRGEASVQQFLKKHGQPGLDKSQVRNALWLLEMQRHGLLMFTSCGWFFDEISGLETTQCLRYAARAIQLARHFNVDLEEEFVRALEPAPSNIAELKTGRVVWERLIRPAQVDLGRVLAHYAIASFYRQKETKSRVYCFDIECMNEEVRSRGNSHVGMGRLHVRSLLTSDEAENSFLVIHYGGLDFHAVLRSSDGIVEYEKFKKKLFKAFDAGSLADTTRLATEEFEGHAYRLEDLFVEEQRRIIGIVMEDRFQDYQLSFERLAETDIDVIHRLGRLHYPIPRPLLAAATLALDGWIRKEVARLDDEGALERLANLLERGRSWGYQPDQIALNKLLSAELRASLRELTPSADLTSLVAHAERILDAAHLLGGAVDLWEGQNLLLNAYTHLLSSGAMNQALHDSFAKLADKLRISQELLGWRP